MIRHICDCCGRERNDETYCEICYNDLIEQRDKALEEISSLETEVQILENELSELRYKISELEKGGN